MTASRITTVAAAIAAAVAVVGAQPQHASAKIKVLVDAEINAVRQKTDRCKHELTSADISALNSSFNLSKTEDEWCSMTSLQPALHGGDFTAPAPSAVNSLYNMIGFTLQELSSVPESLFDTPNLKILTLSGNIDHLPGSIQNASKLEFIDISGVGLNSVAPEVGNLSNLTALDVGENNLTSLPASVCSLDATIDDSGNPGEPLCP